MNEITTLTNLLDVLSRCSGDEYAPLIKKINIPVDEFLPFAYWEKENHTRNCIARTNAYELLLLCWEEGQTTPIHNHNQQECWVYTLSGQLKEVRYSWENKKEKPTPLKEATTTEGTLSYMNDAMGYHALQNIGQGRAISLHLYAAPITECSIWDDETTDFIIKTQSYHTHKGKVLV